MVVGVGGGGDLGRVFTSVCVCVRACVRVCMACVRACVRVCVCVCKECTRVLNVKYVGAGVCLWKKLRRVRGGENVRVRKKQIFALLFFYFIFSLNVPSWADVSTNIFHFYSLYNY